MAGPSCVTPEKVFLPWGAERTTLAAVCKVTHKEMTLAPSLSSPGERKSELKSMNSTLNSSLC